MEAPVNDIAPAGPEERESGQTHRSIEAGLMPGLRATARLQLHQDFGFDAATAQVPYYAALGISHYYLSPILAARQGSLHGYDVVDPTQVNPELGGEAGLVRLVHTLRAHDMGVIVDIVPNHMAVGRADNRWWQDVLEWGPDSAYAHYFDIDWDVPDPALHGKLLLPFLGKPYGEALSASEIRLVFDPVLGKLLFRYYDHELPCNPREYAALLKSAGPSLQPLANRLRATLSSQLGRQRRVAGFREVCAELAHTVSQDAPARHALSAILDGHSARTDEGLRRLHVLLERQHWRIAWWRTAPEEINWRRFFDITELAGLRIQDPEVFEAVHAKLFELYAAGLIDGVRVDHVDGLADPRDYCRKLRAELERLAHRRPPEAPAGRAYLVVEKILAATETLPRDWNTDGTSGYVFMNEVNALQHDPNGEQPLSRLWQRYTGLVRDYDQEEALARRRIPSTLFTADFNACAHALHSIARGRPEWRDWTLEAIRRVLTELLAAFPVYRTYADARGRREADQRIMQSVIAEAGAHLSQAEQPLLEQVDRWLGGEAPSRCRHVVERRKRLRAIARFQQLTAPVAAKAVEDTAFYRYGRLLSRNEVGATPAQFSMSTREFHEACLMRRHRYPCAMLATATHDHKRGEDVRARLAVLSELPGEWSQALMHWHEQNSEADVRTPAADDEYVLYQTIAGAWSPQLDIDHAAGIADYTERLVQWQRKSIREAKRHSSWLEPDETYEAACEDFLRRIMNPTQSRDFLLSMQNYVASIAPAGALNGLTQTLLKLTTPGIPDLYQGADLWDFSLVDPDNRRPVDYGLRSHALHQTHALDSLLSAWHDGQIKQYLIARVLQARRTQPQLYAQGEYRALSTRGAHRDQLIAHARALPGGRVALVMATRLAARWLPAGSIPLLPAELWQDTHIALPAAWRRHAWTDALSDLPHPAAAAMPASQVLAQAPVALLISS